MIRYYLARLSLLTQFSIVSFLVTILIGAGLAAWLEERLRSDALWAVAENAADQAKIILNSTLRQSDFQSPLVGNRFAEIDESIHKTLLSSDIVRIKIWNNKGLLIYSNDPGSVGQIFPISEHLQKALGGSMSTEISPLTDEENITERDQFTRLFEVYIPLQPVGESNVLGAYEVYYDLNQLEPRLARIRSAVWSGVGLGFLILYLSLFFLIRNPSRDLIQRNEENRRLLIAERDQRQLSETLERVSLALSGILDLRKLLDLICRESMQVFSTQAAYLWLVEDEELVGFAAYGHGADQFIGMRYRLDDPILLGARIARTREPLLVNDAPHSSQVDLKLIQFFGIKSILGAPLIKGDRLLGALMIIDTVHPYRFQSADLERASVFGSHASIAIDNARLFEQATLHLEHERSLREIDLAITSNTNLKMVLDIVLHQALTQLKIDAAAISLLNNKTGEFEYQLAVGFRSNIIEHPPFTVRSEIIEYQVSELNQYNQVAKLQPNQVPVRGAMLDTEQFKAYFATPLVSREKLLGLLEVFHRGQIRINAEWWNFLETLAGQTAIAIENADLLSNLQKTNVELSEAYEAAIEGWSAALDLRDRETEGHTQRVTEMTLKLATRMGISSSDLVHIRRGALLHDIGKMGVPDRILLKGGPLTDEEWVTMHKHPSFAYDLLKSVNYLSPALDIPRYHHEKWDGSGYPEGLKGIQIPLAARIFTVVDVFDALSSDRPYRVRWPAGRVMEHIRTLAGIHFDPEVVNIFWKMLTEN